MSSSRIFVGGLPESFTKGDLMEFFRKCRCQNGIQDIEHRMDKPFAFVQFSSHNGAMKAIEKCNGRIIGNSQIIVEVVKRLAMEKFNPPRGRSPQRRRGDNTEHRMPSPPRRISVSPRNFDIPKPIDVGQNFSCPQFVDASHQLEAPPTYIDDRYRGQFAPVIEQRYEGQFADEHVFDPNIQFPRDYQSDSRNFHQQQRQQYQGDNNVRVEVDDDYDKDDRHASSSQRSKVKAKNRRRSSSRSPSLGDIDDRGTRHKKSRRLVDEPQVYDVSHDDQDRNSKHLGKNAMLCQDLAERLDKLSEKQQRLAWMDIQKIMFAHEYPDSDRNNVSVSGGAQGVPGNMWPVGNVSCGYLPQQ